MSNEMPETDLVKLAEREVIEKARKVAEFRRLVYVTPSIYVNQVEIATENLCAAVTLLESREEIERAKREDLAAYTQQGLRLVRTLAHAKQAIAATEEGREAK